MTSSELRIDDQPLRVVPDPAGRKQRLAVILGDTVSYGSTPAASDGTIAQGAYHDFRGETYFKTAGGIAVVRLDRVEPSFPVGIIALPDELKHGEYVSGKPITTKIDWCRFVPDHDMQVRHARFYIEVASSDPGDLCEVGIYASLASAPIAVATETDGLDASNDVLKTVVLTADLVAGVPYYVASRFTLAGTTLELAMVNYTQEGLRHLLHGTKDLLFGRADSATSIGDSTSLPDSSGTAKVPIIALIEE